MPGKEAPLSRVRRRDRAKSDEWIRRFLAQAPFGFLATIAEDRPWVNSNLFVFDDDAHAIYFHTARVGRTPDNVGAGGPATFSAAVMGRFLPAPEALEFSVEYSAVVVFGAIGPVDDDEEKGRAMRLLMEKYVPHLEAGRDYRPITEDELRRTAVHRLSIEAWSGKEKVAERDHPGAFSMPSLLPPAVPSRGVEAQEGHPRS